jgi:hypothetical protein
MNGSTVSSRAAKLSTGPDKSPARSVFINCPYDGDFQRTFDTIVFSVLSCGLNPRCAIESRATSISRMDRIAKALRESHYSVHDLTRCKGERAANLARMNMPLELGMALERNFVAEHEWTVLAPRKHRYDRFISDLAGFDLPTYDEQPESVISPLLAWFGSMPDLDVNPDLHPAAVASALPDFLNGLATLRNSARWDEHLPWKRIVDLGWGIVQQHGFLQAQQTAEPGGSSAAG